MLEIVVQESFHLALNVEVLQVVHSLSWPLRGTGLSSSCWVAEKRAS